MDRFISHDHPEFNQKAFDCGRKAHREEKSLTKDNPFANDSACRSWRAGWAYEENQFQVARGIRQAA